MQIDVHVGRDNFVKNSRAGPIVRSMCREICSRYGVASFTI